MAKNETEPQSQTSAEAIKICKRNCEVIHAQDTALAMWRCKRECRGWGIN